MIPELIRRIWFLLNRRRFERSFDDEMEFHQEMMRRAGRAGFGSTLRLREQARDAWGWAWCDYFWQDLKHGIRLLARSPGFTVVVLAVLSLGIGGNTAVFSIIRATLLKPLPFPDPARLALARATVRGEINPYVSAPDYYDFREQAGCFEGFSAVLGAAPKTTVTGGAEPERAPFTYVEHDLFGTLGAAPAAGRLFTPEEARAGGPPVVLLSARLAQKLFGGPHQAQGAHIAMNGRSHAVVGVMPATFRLLEEVDVSQRAPILKVYLRYAPGARPHIPVHRDAPLSEFEKIASQYPVFRVKAIE